MDFIIVLMENAMIHNSMYFCDGVYVFSPLKPLQYYILCDGFY